MKGEFEQRLRSVIDEVQASPKPIILFIDETHTLVGAGGAAGTGDAANLLKPALARGTLRTIGATTFAEYKKYIEKDPALTRRFQSIQVEEPSEARALLMMRGVASTLETHHKVQILDEALDAAVRLSHRYIPARQLPDKAVSLLDTASARVAVSLHATPAEVDDCRKRITALETEREIITREKDIGLEFDKWGLPVLNAQTFQSTLPKVFFGGDAAFGPKNIITAVDRDDVIDNLCRNVEAQLLALNTKGVTFQILSAVLLP